MNLSPMLWAEQYPQDIVVDLDLCNKAGSKPHMKSLAIRYID